MRQRHWILCAAIALLCACGQASESAGAATQDGVVPIYAVQGNGDESPLRDRDVTVQGIVTGNFLGNAESAGDLGGFYLQEEETDGDPATSDAIFVFSRDDDSAVRVGDRVSVTGRVVEFFGETQLTADTVAVVGRGSIAPVDLALPVTAAVDANGRLVADLEAYEGMLVQILEPVFVADVRELRRFGSIGLAVGRPFEQYTNANPPDVAGYAAHRDRVARSTLWLDDGRRDENVSPPRYLFDGTRSLRVGDEVSGVTANVRYSRGSGETGTEAYRLMPVTVPRFVARNPRPDAPAPADGLRVLSLNALNFFTTLDNGRPQCGPRRNAGCRGADSARELDRQLSKLVTVISSSDADIVGLMEVENGAPETLDRLTGALNAGDDARWASIRTGSIGLDTIRVALLYRSDVVEPDGRFELLDGDVDRRFNSEKNRPSLAQTFRGVRNGWRLTVIVNHFKSKGSDCEDIGDRNRRDGQGNCNGTRTQAALALADWLDSAVFATAGENQLIIGDLNAYGQEDPLAVLERASYRRLDQAGDGVTYSFVFDGQRGALDHAFASAALSDRVVATTKWHINADEPSELDYNLDRDRDASWFDANTPYRSSDHDPLIIDLALATE
ncbi:MAG: ExeM/NucH family extracellular endonuclease [Pseudomonadota bacterium]